AQLHQLRGRVGRGGQPAWCLLHSASAPGSEVAARLGVLERHADGFAVAEADLELRGPGEVFGTRQAGAHRLRTPLRGHALTQLLVDARDAAAAALEVGDPERAPWAAELRRRTGAGVFGEA
ncbi:MAG: DNA helicase RecG, partial [Nannocystaceae bacterium]|nr:DNA helicase RecG [Nannocystaceae bacterium]